MVSVRPISRNDTKPFILGIHYARRMPSISHSFGIFVGEDLEGIVTYGTPPSSTLRIGVCGKDMSDRVIELNRLCLKSNFKNHASILVSRSIKMLPENFIIVSYADTSQGHIGTVYQACNFMYCGLSAKRTDWKVSGKEHLHGQTIADEFRGVPNRAQKMREKYGDKFYLSPRPRKHRYVLIKGSKGFKAKAKANLRYRIEEYPKDKTQ